MFFRNVFLRGRTFFWRERQNVFLKTERELFDIEEELIQDQQRLECFETVLKYILPKGEAHEFIAAQHHTFSEQIDLFN